MKSEIKWRFLTFSRPMLKLCIWAHKVRRYFSLIIELLTLVRICWVNLIQLRRFHNTSMFALNMGQNSWLVLLSLFLFQALSGPLSVWLKSKQWPLFGPLKWSGDGCSLSFGKEKQPSTVPQKSCNNVNTGHKSEKGVIAPAPSITCVKRATPMDWTAGLLWTSSFSKRSEPEGPGKEPWCATESTSQSEANDVCLGASVTARPGDSSLCTPFLMIFAVL